MADKAKKTIGQAIDEIVEALEALDDGSKLTAVRAACEHLGLEMPLADHRSAASLPPPEGTANSGADAAIQPSSIQDIRTLKEQKKPKTATEMACLVAYYLDSLAPVGERKAAITSVDVEKYFKQGGFRLPKRINQVLVDAKSAGYFDSAARGSYKLNPVGHNLVVHTLPRAKA